MTLHLAAAFLLFSSVGHQGLPRRGTVFEEAEDPAVTVLQVASGELLVAFESGAIEVCDPATGATISRLQNASSAASIIKICLSPNEERCAVLWKGGRIEILALGKPFGGDAQQQMDAEPAVVISGGEGPSQQRSQMEWTASGKYLVTWGKRGYPAPPTQALQVWSGNGELYWQSPIVSDVSIHPKLDRIAFVEIDRIQVGWPPDDLELIELPGAFAAISYSPSGTRLAVGGSDRMIPSEGTPQRFTNRRDKRFARLTILDGTSSEVLQQMDPSIKDPFRSQWLHCIAWNPSGDRIACGSGKGFLTSVIRVENLEVELTHYDGGRMHSQHALEWIDNDLVLVQGGGTEALVYDANAPKRRTKTPLGTWLGGVCRLDGTDDVIGLTPRGMARVTPKGMTVHWKR